MSESPRIQIRTGARLHFGLLTVNSKISRQFGGAGMMIDHPGCCLELEVSDRDAVVGPSGERGWESLRNFRRQCPVDQQPPPCRITIQQTIPDHCGFGSGTQIALAVAHGLSLIGSEEQPQTGCLPIDRLADWSGRGRRSASTAFSGGDSWSTAASQAMPGWHHWSHGWRFPMTGGYCWSARMMQPGCRARKNSGPSRHSNPCRTTQPQNCAACC